MQPGLLTGTRVLEFGQIAAGPFTGSLLADLGADVVKVERPDGGDGMRSWPPLTSAGGEAFSENFASLNRNKRSIAVDMKDPTELARLRQLCGRADVIVENFRPGVLARHGLGYAELRQSNPRLVYCSISGYGQSGPYAQKGAFDVTVQAVSGLMSVTGEEGGEPMKCGVPVGDFCAGLYAAYCIVAALLRRETTGEGAEIDCSMLGSLIGISALQTSEYFGTGHVPRPLGSAHPRNAPYQAFRAADRHFVLAAGNDKLWRSVCSVVGRDDLAEAPRFASQTLRAANQLELVEILQPLFETRSAEHWLRELDAQGVPCSPINNFAEIVADEHVEAMGLIQALTLPNGVVSRTTVFPVAIEGRLGVISRPPPRLGQDTEVVMEDWLAEAKQTVA